MFMGAACNLLLFPAASSSCAAHSPQDMQNSALLMAAPAPTQRGGVVGWCWTSGRKQADGSTGIPRWKEGEGVNTRGRKH